MMNLLIIREKIMNFIQRHDRVAIPIVRFVYTFLVLMTLKSLFGYNEIVYMTPIVVGVSFVCAFVPTGVMYIISSVLMVVDLLSLDLPVACAFGVLLIIMYLLYLRLVPGKSWVILLTVVLLVYAPCAIPLVIAMFVGPVGIVPTICGVFIYYFSVHAKELQPILIAATQDTKVNSLSFLIKGMTGNENMFLYMIVFAVVITVTYIIYQSSIKHAWGIAIVTGTIIMIVSMLLGSVWLDDEIDIARIVLGAVLCGLGASVLQFFRCLVDYSRVEQVQFEDDDYYYYVKAVPKVSIAQKNVNVQKINARQKK